MPDDTIEMPKTLPWEDVARIRLYVATTNPGKLRDFALAAAERVSIDPMPGLTTIPAPDEDSLTFEGNARLKASYYSLHAPGQVVLADDSGLEVDTLEGRPGVRSARYADDAGFAGPDGASLDERNNACLLDALSEKAHPQSARYRCVIAAALNGEILCSADGSVEGEILAEPRGTGGFGYDPLFFLPQLQKTMAELDPVARLSCSHRGNALKTLLEAYFAQHLR